jgi:hypothetical protein
MAIRRMNKRAWLRILEAFLGVMIIMGVILFIYSKQEIKQELPYQINQIQKKVLDAIEFNEAFRLNVLSNPPDLEKLSVAAQDNIPSIFNFELKVCSLNDEVNCKKTPPYIQNIYVKDRIITSNFAIFSAKKVRLFIWEK